MDIAESIKNLVKILGSTNSKIHDKIDAYLTLFTHGKKDYDIWFSCMKTDQDNILKIIQKDLKSSNKVLLEALLSFLGEFLSFSDLTSTFDDKKINSIVQALLSLLNTSQEKTVNIRCFWCLSNQKLPEQIMEKYVQTSIEKFLSLCIEEKTKSETVINEGLKLIRRLCIQCPKAMERNLESWFESCFSFVASQNPKNRDTLLEIFESSMEFLLHHQQNISKLLVTELSTKDLGSKLKNLFHSDTCQVHVINVWACMLRLLGESFFDLNRVAIVNPFFKIAEKSFSSKSPEVTLALNNLWRALIDVVFLRPGEFSRKMEKIFLSPVRIRYRNEVLANENLKTQWHLICKIDKDMNAYVGKFIIPLLDTYFPKIDLTQVNGTTTPQLNVVKTPHLTPDQSNKRKNVAATPRTPHVSNVSTILLAADMITQIMTDKKEKLVLKFVKLEIYNGPVVNDENLETFYEKFLYYIMDITDASYSKNEMLLTQLWISFLIRVRNIKMRKDIFYKTCWTKILKAITSLVIDGKGEPLLIQKLLLLIPEDIYGSTLTELKNVEISSYEHVYLFIIDLLLHENIIQKNGFDHERYFILYERMINIAVSSVIGKLSKAEHIIDSVERASGLINFQNLRWRLWSTLTHVLYEYINKSNDVNQGGSLEYKFSASLKILAFPVLFINSSDLGDGTLKDLIKTWTDFYQSFSRAVNLLPGIEKNCPQYELCQSILKAYKEGKVTLHIEKGSSIGMIIQMLQVVVNSFDFTEESQFFSTKLTPTKMLKKYQNPLGNYEPFIEIMGIMMKSITEVKSKDNKPIEPIAVDGLDILDTFFSETTNSSVLTTVAQRTSEAIANVISTEIKLIKVLIKVEKLISSLLNAFERNSSVVFHNGTLNALEKVLISSFASDRKKLRTRAVQFWNNSFGKNDSLSISTCLLDSLKTCSCKIPLRIPGTQTDSVCIPDSQDDMANFPSDITSSAISPLKSRPIFEKSPVKVKGSFLNLGLKSPLKNNPQLIKSPFKDSLNILKGMMSPANNKSTRGKLSFNESSCEFVEIKEHPKRKRILTEHQKEMKRKRHDLPVMYNNLDQSQDTTLFNSFTQDNSTQDSITVIPESNDSTPDFSNPLNAVPESKADQKEAQNLKTEEKSRKSVIKQSENTVMEASRNGEGGAVGSFEMGTLEKTGNERTVTTEKETSEITSMANESVEKKEANDKNNVPHKSIANEESNAVTSKAQLNQPVHNEHNENGNLPARFENKDDSMVEEQDYVPSSQLDSEVKNTSFLQKSLKGINSVKTKCVQVDSSVLLKDSFQTSESIQNVKPMNGDLLSDVIKTSPPLMFQDVRVRNAPEVNDEKPIDEGSSEEDEPLSKIVNSKREVKKEAKILVKKIPPGEKRKKAVLTRNATKRRKSDGDALVKSKKLKRSSLTDPFGFDDNKSKRTSPVANRTRCRGRKKSDKNTGPLDGNLRKAVRTNPKLGSAVSVKEETLNDNHVEGITSKISDNSRTTNEEGSIDATDPKIDGWKVTPRTEDVVTATTEKEVKENFTTTDQPEIPDEVSENLITGTGATKILPESPVPEIKKQLEDMSNNKEQKTQPFSKQLLKLKPSSVLTFPSPVSSPVSLKYVPSLFQSNTTCSFTTKPLPSPNVSPMNGILKKRLGNGNSPSPNKSRRVTFQLPEGTVVLQEDLEVGKEQESDKVAPKTTPKTLNAFSQKRRATPDIKNAVFPELVSCTAPIEKVLPSLTFSRGISHLVRAQNIRTIGDLSALSETQIENLPIRSPKVSTVRSALRMYSSQAAKTKSFPKSPLFKEKGEDSPLMDSSTPPKDGPTLAEEAALLATPSRHGSVKPTSLFTNDVVAATNVVEEKHTVTVHRDNNVKKDTPFDTQNIVALSENFNPGTDGKVQSTEEVKQDLKVNCDKSESPDGKKLDDTDGSITVMEESLSELVDGVEKINDDVTDLKESVSEEPCEISEKEAVDTAQITLRENFTEVVNGAIDDKKRENSETVEKIVANIGTKETQSNFANDIRNASSNKETDTGIQSSAESTVKNTQLHDILDSMESVKVNTDSLNAENVLQNIDFKTLSTEVIFDVVSKLDQLKMTAMEELRTRMFSKPSNMK